MSESGSPQARRATGAPPDPELKRLRELKRGAGGEMGLAGELRAPSKRPSPSNG